MNSKHSPSILIIYTGGTIGMVENLETHALEAFDFEHLQNSVPELEQFDFRIDAITLGEPIDSSDMEPHDWVRMARAIEENYEAYDGFVLLHGTDTMAFTASALSFMLENLAKPVIITGSQLPIGQLRTDGKENLLTSVEIAAARTIKGDPMVPEVCIFFENELLRGNRTTKISAEGFNAFRSYNFPALAKAGIHIDYARHSILYPAERAENVRTNLFHTMYGRKHEGLFVHDTLDSNIVILTLFPGICEETVDALFASPTLRGVILQTFGSGNAPQKPWFVERLMQLRKRGVVVVNISQCRYGTVDMGRYETSLQLLEAGVINGYDSTLECVVTKLMFLLGGGYSPEQLLLLMNTSIAGEITLK